MKIKQLVNIIFVSIALFIITSMCSFLKCENIRSRVPISDYHYETIKINRGHNIPYDRVTVNYKMLKGIYIPLSGDIIHCNTIPDYSYGTDNISIATCDCDINNIPYLDTNNVRLATNYTVTLPEETNNIYRIYSSKNFDMVAKFMDAYTGKYVYEKKIPVAKHIDNKGIEESYIIDKVVLNNGNNDNSGLFFVFLFNNSDELVLIDKIIRHNN